MIAKTHVMNQQQQCRRSMWQVGWILALIFMGSVLPTPLYVIYRKEFQFSEIVLTLVFAAYVVGTLTALSFFGHLSDQVGRRRMTFAALAIAALSTLVFVFARNTAMLFIGRFLSGLASGIVAGTTTAWIKELHTEKDAPKPSILVVTYAMAGLALGPLAAGLVAQYGPLPLRLSYILYLPLLGLAAILTALPRDTVERPVPLREAELKPRIGVPQKIRKPFIAPAATVFATFALSGFYSALAPSLLSQKLNEKNHAIAGGVVFELSLFAAVATLLTRTLKSRTAMLTGMALMLPSIGLLELASELKSMWLLLGAAACGGISMALGYRGSLDVVNEISPEDRRAAVLSSFFIASYIGLSIPVIGVGVLTELVNAQIAKLTFAVVVAVFAMTALVMGRKTD